MRPVVEEIRRRLGDYIYGENETTLEAAIVRMLKEQKLRLAIVESGTKSEISNKLKLHANDDIIRTEHLESYISDETLKSLMTEFAELNQADLVLGVRLSSDGHTQTLYQALLDKESFWHDQRNYAGPIGDGLRWAFNASLDSVRRKLNKQI